MASFRIEQSHRTQVLHWDIPHVQSVSVGLWFRTGSRYEPSRLHGGAHFLEHMLFKGTRRRNALQISEAIESKGGDINAFTAEEMTCYYSRIDSNHLPMVLDVLFDMLWKSSFPAVEIERERGVILEEIRMYEDQPQVVVMEHLNRELWPENSLGRPILGTPETVAGMDRQELMNFWRCHYRPRSLVVSVAGRVDHGDLMNLLDPYLRFQRQSPMPKGWTPVAIKPGRGIRTLAVSKPVQQCSVAIGVLGIPRHDPRRYAEKVLSVILGENMSSRLFQIVREKHGLAYSIHTSVSHFHDTGAFYVQAGVDREKVGKALQLVAKELKRIALKAPTTEELRRAKDYIIGQMKLGMESTSSRMMWMGESMVGLGHILQPEEVMETVQSVTAEQVRQLAEYLFRPGRMVVACVGPEMDDKELAAQAKVFCE